jgi:hypothetical protein
MDRCAVFVDAGWFLSEAAFVLTGRGSRRAVECDYRQFTLSLKEIVFQATRLPLLRIYWYDAAPDGIPGPDHLAIANLDNVKLRLGRISHHEQKGVDALLILDLTTLARERAIASAVVISGDEDIRDGIAVAQSFGVHVTLGAVAMREGRPSQSTRLVREVDEQLALDMPFLRRCMTVQEPDRDRVPVPSVSAVPSAPAASVVPSISAAPSISVAPAVSAAPAVPAVSSLSPVPSVAPNEVETPREYGFQFGTNYADTLGDDELRALQREAPEMPAEVAGQLFREAEQSFGPLRGRMEIRRELRGGFWDHVMRRRNT